MMIVVKAHATIQDFLTGYTNETTLELSVLNEAKVADAINILNLPQKEIGLIVVNGVCCSVNTQLKQYDVVEFFPPIMGG